MTFEARTERRAGATIVTFRGDLDIALEADAAACLEAAIDGAGVLVADLRALDFLDSTGVRVLLSADLRALVRGGASDEELEGTLRRIWEARDDRYSEIRSAETVALPKVEMSYIGG